MTDLNSTPLRVSNGFAMHGWGWGYAMASRVDHISPYVRIFYGFMNRLEMVPCARTFETLIKTLMHTIFDCISTADHFMLMSLFQI